MLWILHSRWKPTKWKKEVHQQTCVHHRRDDNGNRSNNLFTSGNIWHAILFFRTLINRKIVLQDGFDIDKSNGCNKYVAFSLKSRVCLAIIAVTRTLAHKTVHMNCNVCDMITHLHTHSISYRIVVSRRIKLKMEKNSQIRYSVAFQS